LEHLYLVKEMETKRERRIEGKGHTAETWEGEWVRVKLHDAYTALRDIAKMHGKLTDRVDLTTGGDKINNMTPEQIAEKINALLLVAQSRKKQDAD